MDVIILCGYDIESKVKAIFADFDSSKEQIFILEKDGIKYFGLAKIQW